MLGLSEASYHLSNAELWPELPLEAWQNTYATLHRWMQIVGKLAVALAPEENHWWHTTLHLTPRGLRTVPLYYGILIFHITFDFIDHVLCIEANNGSKRYLALSPRSVADFYQEFMAQLRSLNIETQIWTTPVEIEDRTPFEQDLTHASYDPEYAQRHWQLLTQIDHVFKQFRGHFVGKVSPVQFFWGSFDLAVTRFTGHQAPDHPGGPNVARYVMQEAYSHEVSSCGFWAGAGLGMPAFYSYVYPEPEGFKAYPIQPEEAYYSTDLKEFLLPYEAVRTSDKPAATLLAFLQSTYEAAATTGQWNRNLLER